MSEFCARQISVKIILKKETNGKNIFTIVNYFLFFLMVLSFKLLQN